MIDRLDDHNFIWTTPSRDATGSMPLGNGDLALNLWVEPSGDLLLLLAKSDAWDENSINLKLGRIRIKLTPNPFKPGENFRQTLRLKNAQIEIDAADAHLRIWVNANAPVIHIEADGDQPFEMEASLEVWRTAPRAIQTQTSDMFKNLAGKNADPHPTIVGPDQVLDGPANSVTWCHHNERCDPDPYEVNLRLQGLGHAIEQMHHPLQDRTFGASMLGANFTRTGLQNLRSTSPSTRHRLNIFALTLHPATPSQWLDTIQRQAAQPIPPRADHDRWWRDFWTRSWLFITADSEENSADAFRVTQAYILQRFMNAAAGRTGPIKHNGSLFTVGNPDDPDFRRWGGPGFWFQNQRLIYWPMLASGDFDLLRPWLEMYFQCLPLARLRTKSYFQHPGAHFPETITFWGAEVSSHYGWTPFEQRDHPEAESPYLKYYWTGALELTLLMVEYFTYTADRDFARSRLIPFATAIIEFFDRHYARDPNGRIRFEPAQSLETWHEAINPLPEIAGLQYTLNRLLSLPPDLIPDQERIRWQRMLSELPKIPTGQKDGHSVILPAERFDRLKNSENPELYCIFPYRLFGLGKPDLQLAHNTFDARLHRAHVCWSQDDIQLALLGRADEARDFLIKRASPESHSDSRFPAFWNAFHDWVPDVDHAGVLQLALQFMLLQADGNSITLLPAWPQGWNADFKLHAPNRTIIEASVRNGQITHLEVTAPESKPHILIAQNRK
jgi:alpha-L-fucosidase 2